LEFPKKKTHEEKIGTGGQRLFIIFDDAGGGRGGIIQLMRGTRGLSPGRAIGRGGNLDIWAFSNIVKRGTRGGAGGFTNIWEKRWDFALGKGAAFCFPKKRRDKRGVLLL